MQLWKRRLAVLVAIGAGSVALVTTSSAGAQTSPPTSIPDFTFPSVPEFPTFPTFTLPTTPPPTMPPPTFTIPSTLPPPPTMPPPSLTTLPPPPTMPPTTFTIPPPPTMPPTSFPTPTVPDLDELVEEFLDQLEGIFQEGEAGFEELQQILENLRNRF